MADSQWDPLRDMEERLGVRLMNRTTRSVALTEAGEILLARVAPGKAQCGIEGYFACWERAVEVFGRGTVTTYVLLGMGERPELMIEPYPFETILSVVRETTRYRRVTYNSSQVNSRTGGMPENSIRIGVR